MTKHKSKTTFPCVILAIFVSILLSGTAWSTDLRVAVVKSSEIAPYQDAVEGFRKTCGCSINEFLASDPDLLRQLRSGSRFDAVLAVGLDAQNRLEELNDIPIISIMVPPWKEIWGKKNMSGVSMTVGPARQVEEISSLFPKARRIAVLYDPSLSEDFFRNALRYAQTKELTLLAVKIRNPQDISRGIEALGSGADLFWMLPDENVANPEALNYLLLFSLKNRTPVFTFAKKFVTSGAVAGLAVEPREIGAQAGTLLRSGRYRESGLYQYALEATLIVNRKVADKLGIRFSDAELRRAQIIE